MLGATGGSVTLVTFWGHVSQELMATKIEVSTLEPSWLLKRYIRLLRGCHRSGRKPCPTRLTSTIIFGGLHPLPPLLPAPTTCCRLPGGRGWDAGGREQPSNMPCSKQR
jgi:hypothetical protein